MSNNKAIKLAVVWKFAERFIVQGFQFVVQIVLARILIPEDYGSVAVVAAFITILNVILQAGVSKSIVQFKNINSSHIGTAFTSNFILSIILYFIFIATAPFIQSLIKVNDYTSIALILGLNLIIGVFNTVQDSLIIRYRLYKYLFLSSALGVVISGCVGITLALLGAGLWSLVAQQLTNQMVCSLALWLQTGFRPKLIFSYKKFIAMWRFSWKISTSFFIDVIFQNAQSIALAGLFNTKSLGLISKGQQLPLLLATNIDGIVQPITLRELSIRQNKNNEIKLFMSKSIHLCSYVLFPVMFACILFSREIIIFLLSEKWVESSNYVIFFSLYYLLIPLSSINIQALNAIGKSSFYLRNEIVKKVVGVIVLSISLIFGLQGFCFALVFYGFFSFLLDLYTTGKLIGYGIIDQFKEIVPYIVFSIITCLVVLPVKFLRLSELLILIIGCTSGGLFYYFITKIFRMKGMIYLLNIIFHKE